MELQKVKKIVNCKCYYFQSFWDCLQLDFLKARKKLQTTIKLFVCRDRWLLNDYGGFSFNLTFMTDSRLFI